MQCQAESEWVLGHVRVAGSDFVMLSLGSPFGKPDFISVNAHW